MKTQPSILVVDSKVHIVSLDVGRRDVADFFEKIDDQDRENMLTRAIEIGVFCLERAQNTSDLEYVRRQVETLLSRIENAVGLIPTKTEAALLQRIGVNDGQVLAPIKSLIAEVSQTTTVRLNDVRNLLSQDLDPTKNTSTIGKVLQKLLDLLDAERNDSVPATIENATRSITAENGALVTAVTTVVLKALAPLESELKDLAKEIRGQTAATEALEQTTAKGVSYEEEALTELREWARMNGAEVYHVGGDNQPGDILVKLSPSILIAEPFVLVIEARDRQTGLGRKTISDILRKAMSARSAKSGIYVSRFGEGLAKEIGDWAEGECDTGRFVACTHDHLISAVRWLMIQQQLHSFRASAPEFDPTSMEPQIGRIRTALDRIKSINRKISDIRGSAEGIQQEAEILREEVRGALSTMEDVLRASAAPRCPATSTPTCLSIGTNVRQ